MLPQSKGINTPHGLSLLFTKFTHMKTSRLSYLTPWASELRLLGRPKANRAGLHGSYKTGRPGRTGQEGDCHEPSTGLRRAALTPTALYKVTAAGLGSDRHRERRPSLMAGVSVTNWTRP